MTPGAPSVGAKYGNMEASSAKFPVSGGMHEHTNFVLHCRPQPRGYCRCIRTATA